MPRQRLYLIVFIEGFCSLGAEIVALGVSGVTLTINLHLAGDVVETVYADYRATPVE